MSASLHSSGGVGLSLHAKEQVDLTASPRTREREPLPYALALEQNKPVRAALLRKDGISACMFVSKIRSLS